MKSSARLNMVVKELLEADPEFGFDQLSITTGYDNDGSTGAEMVEIGIELGVELEKKGWEYEVWLAHHPEEHVAWPVIAKNEEEAERIFRKMAG